MGSILEKIEQALKDMLMGWIESNLTNMFTDVNEKVGTIAAEVGQTPSGWNGGASTGRMPLSRLTTGAFSACAISRIPCTGYMP